MSDDLLPTPDILIAMVAIGSGIHRVEAIEFEGELWLVPNWFEHPGEGWMQPARMVSLKAVRHHRVAANDFQIVVEVPLPADMMSPRRATETAKKTEVRDTPPIRFRRRAIQ